MKTQIYDDMGVEFEDGDYFIYDAGDENWLCKVGYNPFWGRFDIQIFDGSNNEESWESEPMHDYISVSKLDDSCVIADSEIVSFQDIKFYTVKDECGRNLLTWLVGKFGDFFEAVTWLRKKPESRKIIHQDLREEIVFLNYKLTFLSGNKVVLDDEILDGFYELVEEE